MSARERLWNLAHLRARRPWSLLDFQAAPASYWFRRSLTLPLPRVDSLTALLLCAVTLYFLQDNSRQQFLRRTMAQLQKGAAL